MRSLLRLANSRRNRRVVPSVLLMRKDEAPDVQLGGQMTYKDIAIINRAWCPVCNMPRYTPCLMSNLRSLVKMHIERRAQAEKLKRDGEYYGHQPHAV